MVHPPCKYLCRLIWGRTTTMCQGRGMRHFGERICRLHPLASRLRLLPHHRLTSHPLCLFICPFFVSLAGCCIVSLPLVGAHPIPLHRHAKSLRCISSLVIPLISSSSSRCIIASRLASSLLSSHDVDVNALVAHLPRLDGIDRMAR
jgi:hypothetical protein